MSLALNAQLSAADLQSFAGVWKWETVTPNGETRESTLRLRIDEGKLKGTLDGAGAMPLEIADAKLEESVLSFKVVRRRDGREQFASYQGHLDGKLIKGKVESNFFGGDVRRRDWEGMREADFAARPPNLNGEWRYSFPGHSGQAFEPVLKLKHDGSQITGTLQFNEHMAAITEARLEGNDLWIKIVRDRDGQPLVTVYTGKINGNQIEGNIEADWAGVRQQYRWQARRQRR